FRCRLSHARRCVAAARGVAGSWADVWHPRPVNAIRPGDLLSSSPVGSTTRRGGTPDGVVRQAQDRFGVTVHAELAGGLGRSGVLNTPHGDIAPPAFTPVGTKATIKGVLPESMAELGAQALLANAYHLFLQPGPDIVDGAGGLSEFMNWPGPTFTDSGGFQ